MELFSGSKDLEEKEIEITFNRHVYRWYYQEEYQGVHSMRNRVGNGRSACHNLIPGQQCCQHGDAESVVGHIVAVLLTLYCADWTVVRGHSCNCKGKGGENDSGTYEEDDQVVGRCEGNFT